ncbi:Gfo/Idh/MocA family protein [Microlunatus parietis]|uniref:Putative dehydrogenase n=1 Tax=Microlunatus parietis TaxID=682979 RepID=A0A7Y9I499_9ACTN|nr:Gfo/Idh/MocA family oxidoreductase [Microlunatus parietis]NYE69848.1 putative dehydrogenase [Microlunatus parietis]
MLQVAVLGAAHPHIGEALEEIAWRDDVALVAASEPDAAMRERFLGGVSAPVYASHAELLERHQIDVAVVSGIYAQRSEAVLTALAAGAHVFADKPLCTTLEQLDEITKAFADSDRRLGLMFTKRFSAATVAAKRLVDEGVLGELALIATTGPHKLTQANRPAWFFDSALYGGAAGDLPVHDVDLALFFTGATSGTVSAATGNVRSADHPDFDDHVALLLRAGSAIATIEANWLSPEAAELHGHYRMRLSGSEGTAEIDWGYETLTVATHDRPTWTEPLQAPLRPMQFFFDAIIAGTEPAVTTEESLLATRVALLAQQSAESGGVPLAW